jgi:hypothetical protein
MLDLNECLFWQLEVHAARCGAAAGAPATATGLQLLMHLHHALCWTNLNTTHLMS